MQIKVQVLHIPPKTERSYKDQVWFTRPMQCIGMDKVFVHNVTAPVGNEPKQLEAQKILDSYDAGFYMVDLELEQGDRGKPVFALRNFTKIKNPA